MPSEKIELPPLPPLDKKMSIPYEYIRLIPGYAEVTVHELMTAYALLAVKQERERICLLLETHNISFPMHGKPELMEHVGSGSHNGMHYAAAIRKGS